MEDFCKMLFGDNLMAVLARVFLSAAIWFIWRERNARVFQNVKNHKVQLLREIQDTVEYEIIYVQVLFCPLRL